MNGAFLTFGDLSPEGINTIEPLSRGDIDKIYERIDDYYNASWTHKFARAIEAHILGEKS